MEIVLLRFTNKTVKNILRRQCFSNMHFILFQKALWFSGVQSEILILVYYDKAYFIVDWKEYNQRNIFDNIKSPGTYSWKSTRLNNLVLFSFVENHSQGRVKIGKLKKHYSSMPSAEHRSKFEALTGRVYGSHARYRDSLIGRDWPE